jgi:septal ring factor EnvC (AmiA/AmiB activator)
VQIERRLVNTLQKELKQSREEATTMKEDLGKATQHVDSLSTTLSDVQGTNSRLTDENKLLRQQAQVSMGCACERGEPTAMLTRAGRVSGLLCAHLVPVAVRLAVLWSARQ